MRGALVVVAGVALASGCGGAGKPATSSVTTTATQSKLFTSRSPDGRWVVSANKGCRYLSFAPASGGKPERFAAPADCGADQPLGVGGTWVPPHVLLIGNNNAVASINPATRTAKGIAALMDTSVSANGEWIAGSGDGDWNKDPAANTTYVVSLRGHPRCLVVPGLSFRLIGFTRDSKNVIVRGETQIGGNPTTLRRFAVASLHRNCPTGPNGILQSAVYVNTPGW